VKLLGVTRGVVYKGFKDSALPTIIRPVEPDPQQRNRVRKARGR
jgi:hypothetical protein